MEPPGHRVNPWHMTLAERGYAHPMANRPQRQGSFIRELGDRIEIEAREITRFLSSPAGRRMRGVLAGAIIVTAPLIFRIPGLRRYPLIRALEFIGGAALIVRFAEALRDWERGEQGPMTIDLN
jgi:hypothetical protein